MKKKVNKLNLNKKGQDLSIGTLILIVLGIVVLVLLILGFSLGWENLWEKINIFGGGSSIGEVVTRCNLDVNTQNTYDYCQDFKKVKIEGKTEYLNCQDNRLNLDSTLECDETQVNEAKKTLCLTLAGQGKADTKINKDETCSQYVQEACTLKIDCVAITNLDNCKDGCEKTGTAPNKACSPVADYCNKDTKTTCEATTNCEWGWKKK